MKEKIAYLIDVKTIVTFVIVGTYVALALTGKIQADQVSTTTATVIAFYFGTKFNQSE